MGVRANDEVIAPALSFIGSAAPIVHQNAIPVFADVSTDTFNIDPSDVERRLTPRTRAIIAVHMHGLPCDMDALLAIGRKHDVPIVEDFSLAVGADFSGTLVGGIGKAGAASLMASKNLPAPGEAGVLVTDDPAVRNAADTLKAFGQIVGPDGTSASSALTFGYNYRLSSLHAAYLCSQLKRLDYYNSLRQENAGLVTEQLKSISFLKPPRIPVDRSHVFHGYRFTVDAKRGGLPVESGLLRRNALQKIFWAEGLRLIEFQNAPLPAHPLFQTARAQRMRDCRGMANGRGN